MTRRQAGQPRRCGGPRPGRSARAGPRDIDLRATFVQGQSRELWDRNREIYIEVRAVIVMGHRFLFRPDRPAVLRACVYAQLARRYRGRLGGGDIVVFLAIWKSRPEYIKAAARARWQWGLFPSLPERSPDSYRAWARKICRKKGWKE